jgi:mono/diheme cytochrome c family protein
MNKAMIVGPRIAFVVVTLLGSVAPGPWLLRANSQEIGDAAAGKQLAERWCSSCHVVGPASTEGTSNGAPPFVAVARMKSTTPMSLRAFLLTPHTRMPDLHLSQDEIDNLTAYILSMRGS